MGPVGQCPAPLQEGISMTATTGRKPSINHLVLQVRDIKDDTDYVGFGVNS